MGLSKEQLNRRLTEESLVDAVIRRELRSRINIGDAEVREFYDTGTDLVVKLMQADLEKLVKDPAATPQQVADLKQRIDDQRKGNLSRLQQPEQVRVQHVFMSTRDRQTETLLPEEARYEKRRRLERLRERALAGEDFTKLVMEFSEDRGLKETRGEYTFAREAPFAEEFKAAAFSLETGKFSDVVTTSYGFHVIKLIEKIPSRKLELDKLSADLKDFLTQQEVVRSMPDYFAKLRQDAAVEIISPKYRAARPEPERIPEATRPRL
jgi:parvulin-like peptidyl-prolyl isomerase